MKVSRPDIIYSDPVKDIISNPPRKIVRFGTGIFFLLLILLLLLSWLIRYPDIVRAAVTITTKNPPATLNARISGRISKLIVSDGQKVKSGQLLAVMETAASAEEVLSLESSIDTITKPAGLSLKKIPSFTAIGEIQGFFTSFITAISDYKTFLQNDFYGSKIESVTREVESLQEYIGKIKTKENLYAENLKFQRIKAARDSVLHKGGYLADSDWEVSKQELLQKLLEFQEIKLEYSAKTIEMAEKKQILQDYIIQRKTDKEKFITNINEALLNLKAQIRIWKIKYLLISPVGGTVTFTKYWSENQTVKEDEPVLFVVPENAGEIIGRVDLKMPGSGKVKPGYAVNIKLSGYPYLEYGMVRGTVRSKSSVASGDSYAIEISLPDGLTTLYGKRLEFDQNMQGTAEIITEDIRLLQKIINPFRHLLSRNKRSLQ